MRVVGGPASSTGSVEAAVRTLDPHGVAVEARQGDVVQPVVVQVQRDIQFANVRRRHLVHRRGGEPWRQIPGSWIDPVDALATYGQQPVSAAQVDHVDEDDIARHLREVDSRPRTAVVRVDGHLPRSIIVRKDDEILGAAAGQAPVENGLGDRLA